MKLNRTLIVIGLVFLCFCFASLIVGYTLFQSRPPSSLSDSGYYIRGSKIYYHPGFGIAEPFEILGADHDAFVILDQRYALDTSHVFYDGIPIPDSDPSTFEILKPPFSRDSKHVYTSGNTFSDDPVNFEILGENISRDSHHIYWDAEVISDDPSHLVVIGNSGLYTYLKDLRMVFVYGNPIQGADPATFEVIADGFSRDASHIFYFDEIIPQADSATFEVVQSPYARDINAVFWMKNIIPGADPKTFQVLNANFECSADSEHAYYQNVIIQNAVPSTFPPNSIVTNCTETNIFFSP